MRSIAQRPVDNQRYPKSRGENVAEAYGSVACVALGGYAPRQSRGLSLTG